jgi:hypothetical protein
MAHYNRVRGVQWPVVFAVSDGRRFTVWAPQPSPVGPVLLCHVEGGAGAGDYEIGPYYSEQSAGAVIGRTIRTWIERTGEGIAVAKR